MNHLRHLSASLLNLIFPPICLCCKESYADKWFCDPCWQLLAFGCWTSRCRHCFEETERLLCDVCRKQPLLCFPRVRLFDTSPAALILRQHLEEIEETLAAMAFVFWDHLALAEPDVVIAVPDERGSSHSFQIARYLAKFFNRPCIQGLKRTYSGYLEADIALSCAAEPEQIILLLDVASSTPWLQKASSKAADFFPKKVFVISIFESPQESEGNIDKTFRSLSQQRVER